MGKFKAYVFKQNIKNLLSSFNDPYVESIMGQDIFVILKFMFFLLVSVFAALSPRATACVNTVLMHWDIQHTSFHAQSAGMLLARYDGDMDYMDIYNEIHKRGLLMGLAGTQPQNLSHYKNDVFAKYHWK